MIWILVYWLIDMLTMCEVKFREMMDDELYYGECNCKDCKGGVK